jgi:hypothetical protein
MKGTSLALFSLVFAAPLVCHASGQLIPAGSLIQCTVSEPKLSSKNTAIGDPVLCQIGHAERYGRSVLPYGSFLVGRFEDYKDPGHFVGKGWMELRFDRMVIEPDTVIPVDARVVAVPGYNVDRYGRIRGKGHEARDIVMWTIPVLWPVDLLMLPMRGPRPTLRGETRLTLKVMDDLEIPATEQPQRDPSGLLHRTPSASLDPAPLPDAAPPSEVGSEFDPMEDAPAPPAYSYAPPPPVYGYAPPPAMAYAYVAPPAYAYAAHPMIYRYGGPGASYRYGGRAMAFRGAAPGPGARYAAPGPRAGWGRARGGGMARGGMGFRR